MSRDKSTPEKEVQYKKMLSAALRAGYDVLSSGGEAMDAAVAAVTVLEGLFSLFLACALDSINVIEYRL